MDFPITEAYLMAEAQEVGVDRVYKLTESTAGVKRILAWLHTEGGMLTRAEDWIVRIFGVHGCRCAE